MDKRTLKKALKEYRDRTRELSAAARAVEDPCVPDRQRLDNYMQILGVIGAAFEEAIIIAPVDEEGERKPEGLARITEAARIADLIFLECFDGPLGRILDEALKSF